MPKPFESNQIGQMTIKNRFVRSATYEALAEKDGRVTPRLLECMAHLAKGGVGLIITGHAYVAKEGQAGPRQLGIYSDAQIEGLTQLVKTVHQNESLVVAQLAHAGQRGIGRGDFSAKGPSDVVVEGKKTAAAMTATDIQNTIHAFGDAADRAVQAGFDGVQIHSAHGYMLSQFLSSYYNHRKDAYGGPIENRARLLVEIYEEIRRRVGAEFPVMVKINAEDFLENGLTVDEMIRTCKMLEEKGIHAVEMSGGTMDSGRLTFARKGTSKSTDLEVYYKEAARQFKSRIKVPLILVGGFLTYDIVHDTVATGLADMVALSRPFIREPDLVNRWQSGDTQKAACISCNKCFASLGSETGLRCLAEK